MSITSQRDHREGGRYRSTTPEHVAWPDGRLKLTSGGVQQNSVLFHHLELRLVNHVVSLRIQKWVQGDEIRLLVINAINIISFLGP